MSNWDTWTAGHRLGSAAWAQVRSDESGRLWDRLEAAFRLCPSMYGLPGIDEPTPSIAYDLTYEDGTRAEPVWVNRTLLSGSGTRSRLMRHGRSRSTPVTTATSG